jgi:TetR/AcrR family transcriptional regulator, cholesterol catabolism regulator
MKIRKASLFHYVRTKEDLLWMVVEPPLRQLVANAQVILSPDSDAPAMKKLSDAMEAHARSFDELYPHMFVITQEHGKSLTASRRTEFDALRESYTQLWVDAVEAGMKSGELRGDIDARLTTYAILGMLNWMFRWYAPGRRFSSDEVAHQFASLVGKGLIV